MAIIRMLIFLALYQVPKDSSAGATTRFIGRECHHNLRIHRGIVEGYACLLVINTSREQRI
jgi:hypothetical protein